MPIPASYVSDAPAAASLSVRCWHQLMAGLSRVIASHGIHPSEVIVLLPYAQLIPQARHAWAEHAGRTFFVPRFETTMNWAHSVGGQLGMFTPSGVDLRMDVSIDMLTAASLLERAGLGAQQDALAGRLVEAAWSLGRVAAAVQPEARQAWSESLAEALGVGLDSPVLALEAAVGRIALVWAAASTYASDRLFLAAPSLLVVVQGFQVEPVAEALKVHFGEQALSVPLCLSFEAPDFAPAPPPSLHAALDAEDEACRAAACVLAHLSQGRFPVALVAQDRQLTRRVAALLAQRKIAMRDETGWTLSTTRAAAGLMALLRALPWDVSADAVIDWLKHAPAFAASTAAAETEMRKFGLRAWRDLPKVPLERLAATQPLALQVNALRESLARPRPLAAWLRDLRAALQLAGQWEPLAVDAAGQLLLDVLRLHEGANSEFDAAPAMKLRAFTSWVSQALESQTFSPAHPAVEQVVILPLAQLLGRPMQAVVLPGCDEIRLPVSPEPPGQWTASQRELLGLPSRETLTKEARRAWEHALQMPHVELLWRTSEAGERLMPSGFVQELLLDLDRNPLDKPASDPRRLRLVAARPTPRPMPTGEQLPVKRLSASSYGDLRACPYRFFALRQLGLQASGELESELDKRDFGNWLHSLLCSFHEALKVAPEQELPARIAMINVAAEQAARSMGLGTSEFLPFAAAWEPVRDGYLAWLAAHEASGTRFEAGEIRREMPLGALTLIGQIDRMDRQAGGELLLIDYKTEPGSTTAERIKSGLEDSQLAFYAALMPDDTLAAAYVNLGEKKLTRAYAQANIVEMRDALIDGILMDMGRIAEGAPLLALGEGAACTYCAVRGLCRKDFWTV